MRDCELLEEPRVRELLRLRFQVKSPILESLISEFHRHFIPMMREIKEYGDGLDFDYSLAGRAKRLEEAIRDPELYYFSFMSLPSDESRIRSLEVTMGWIYELWVLKLACEALGVSRFVQHVRETETLGGRRQYWLIQQCAGRSTCVGETPFGDVSFWLEECEFESWLRPDILVARGHFVRTSDFLSSGKPVDVLVECKGGLFTERQEEVTARIHKYLQHFRPGLLVLASLHRVPIEAKRALERCGVAVVDELKPGSDRVDQFKKLVLSYFKSRYGS